MFGLEGHRRAAAVAVAIAVAGGALATGCTTTAERATPAGYAVRSASLQFEESFAGNRVPGGYAGTVYSGLLTYVQVHGAGQIRLTDFRFATQSGPVKVLGIKLLRLGPGTLGIGSGIGSLARLFPMDHLANPADAVLTAQAPEHWEILFQWRPTAKGHLHLAQPEITYTDGLSTHTKRLDVDYTMDVTRVGIDPQSYGPPARA